MKLTVRAKKIIALVLVVCIAMPLVANAGLFDGLRVAASAPVNADVSASVSNAAAVDEELMQAIIDSGIGSNLAVSDEGDFITSSSSVIDAVATDIVKNTATTGTADSDDGDTAVDTGMEFGYSFNMNDDSYTYDFFKKFTFPDENDEEKEYVGVYNDNLKKTDNNINLAIEDIGSVENPYIIVEVSSSPAISEVRPHVGDQGLFDLSKNEIEAIELTEDEILGVKINLLYELTADEDIERFKDITGNDYFGIWNYGNYDAATLKKLEEGTVSVLWSINKRGTKSVADVVARMEKNLINCKYGITEKEYIIRLNNRLRLAEEYKVASVRSAQYQNMFTSATFDYSVDYQREYQVDSNGNFIIYDDSTTTTKEYALTSVNGYSGRTNAIDGEYALSTNQNFNYARLQGNSAFYSQLFVSNYTFRKACLDLAYDTKIENGKAVSQEPYIDEYIFAGWYYVNKEGSLEKVTKNTTSEELNDVTELYTSWSVRKYGETEFTKLAPDAGEGVMQRVEIGTGNDSYVVYVPKCIASLNSGTYHDPRNQLFMCVPVRARKCYTWSQSFDKITDLQNLGYVSYVERFRSWDFDFSRSEYNTGEKLLNVAPALTPDTDYRVNTYNAILTTDEDGNPHIEYYPYNVQVVTVTTNELNKMVYADYADSETDAGKYMDSDRVNKFLDNVDFMYFSNTAAVNLYYSFNYEKLQYQDLTFGTTVVQKMAPNVGRAPNLYTVVDANDETGELTLSYVSSDESFEVIKKYKRVVDTYTGLYTLEPVGDDKWTAAYGVVSDIKDKDSVETLVKTTTTFMGEYNAGRLHDLEWQVAYKIYLRAATPVITSDPDGLYKGIKQQGRRIALIVSEILTDTIATQSGAGDPMVKEQSDGTYEFTSQGCEGNLFKLLMMFFECTDPTFIYDYYVRDRAELKYLSLNKDDIAAISYETIYDYEYKQIVSGVRGDSMVNYKLPVTNAKKIYKGTRYTGYFYGLEKWNYVLFYPFEMMYDGDADLLHETVTVEYANGKCVGNTYNPYNSNTMQKLYTSLGLAYHTDFKNIANPFVYTFNADNSMAGQFFDYTITEIANPTNGGCDGNTYLAFDYFREVRPFEIVNGKIAPRSAIEFMVQNSQNGIITYMDRYIEILNDDYSEKYLTPGRKSKTIEVDTVVVDDFSKATWNINYMFSTTSKNRYYVVEYLWTKNYQAVDNDNRQGQWFYNNYTIHEDADLKWYVMPKSSNTSDASNYYKTKELNVVDVKDANGNVTGTKDELTQNVVDNIIPEYRYYFDALIKPNVLAQASDATYIIAVKQYEDVNSYKKGDEPLSITLKNVALDKMSHMFYLD